MRAIALSAAKESFQLFKDHVTKLINMSLKSTSVIKSEGVMVKNEEFIPMEINWPPVELGKMYVCLLLPEIHGR